MVTLVDKGEVGGRLTAFREEIHARFAEVTIPGDETQPEIRLHEARLAQFDSALATVSMAVEHLFDEDQRHLATPLAHRKAIGAFVRPE